MINKLTYQTKLDDTSNASRKAPLEENPPKTDQTTVPNHPQLSTQLLFYSRYKQTEKKNNKRPADA